MKITSGQNVILQEDKEPSKKSVTPHGFDDLLANELGQCPTQGLTSSKDENTALLLSKVQSANAESLRNQNIAVSTMGMHEVAFQIDSLFSNMETYAAQLDTSNEAGLKKPFALLEEISAKITRLRADYPDMEKADPTLASLVNELDVLTTTETFKLNRGDYL